MNSKISYAVAAILGGASCSAAAAEPATGSYRIRRATRSPRSPSPRSGARENIQDVPISMQALTGQTLQQLNIQTFDDYIKYLPNVTSASNGPGQNEVFMRGLSAGSQASQGSGSTGRMAQRRHLPGQPVRSAPGSQPRHLRRRPESHRGAGRSAGHAVRCRRRGRRDPLHHQRAEARCHRGQRHRPATARPLTGIRTAA